MASQLSIDPIFSSFLLSGELDLDHDKIYKWLCSHNQNNANVIHLSMKESGLQDLFDELSDIFGKLHLQIGLRPQYCQHLERGWINYRDDPGFTISHAHSHASFVSVYYPHVEGNVGELEILTPNPLTQWVFGAEQDPKRDYCENLTLFTSTRLRIPPKTGLFVCFPSWIQHMALPTDPNKGERISIAIDSTIQPRATL